MILKKWNYETREYDEVELPDLNYSLYKANFDTIVNCPHCQRELRFGDSYTSREFHDEYEFGYAVCEECYDQELHRLRLDRRRKE